MLRVSKARATDRLIARGEGPSGFAVNQVKEFAQRAMLAKIPI